MVDQYCVRRLLHLTGNNFSERIDWYDVGVRLLLPIKPSIELLWLAQRMLEKSKLNLGQWLWLSWKRSASELENLGSNPVIGNFCTAFLKCLLKRKDK